MVNLLIHFFAALILFKTIRMLLNSGNCRYWKDEKTRFIALTATVLWALHPIQTQAVTYIVQRSTSLAAVFFIAAIYFYGAGRRSENCRYQIVAFTGCVLCYLLALASKLNTALLPASLWLVEVLFFQDLKMPDVRRRIIWMTLGIGGLLLVGCLGFLWIWKGNPIDYFPRAYQGRPFTLFERLLTEPRVLWLYLSQIFWPLPGRFSLVHEITISTSFLQPWTTIPSLIGILGIIGAGLLAIRRAPLIALAILFYFLNHLIESTVIPLELVFEHRNYLPSMFLFVPVAAALQKGINATISQKRFQSGVIVAGTILLFIALGWATHSRNSMWHNKKLFWEDVLVKAPHTARPYLQLAAYHESRRNFPLALKLYAHSLNLYDPAPKRVHALALTNMGVLFQKTHKTGLAIDHFRRALAIFPEHEIARYNLIFSLLSEGEYQRALDNAMILLEYNPRHPYYLNTAGLIRLQMGSNEEARRLLENALAQKSDDVNTLTNLGVALGRLGHNRAAAKILETAIRLAPNNPTPRLCLIDLSLKEDQPTVAEDYTRKLLLQVPLGIIDRLLTTTTNGVRLYDRNIVGPFIRACLIDFEINHSISDRF
ncbi:MAG: tetratricopeptide repeat protein [Desulfobacteraceae bacterium]|nr:tetratricopeptide repeat protein [Desulfobacteraceae bacterium]MBC2749002.1 tetratricopeptide repeat protein [Desulfobacteraceae bacterium]